MNYRLKTMRNINILDFLFSLKGKIGTFGWMGNKDIFISGDHYIKSFDEATVGTITFKYFKKEPEDKIVTDVLDSAASVVIVDKRLLSLFTYSGLNPFGLLIFVENVKLSIVKFLHQVTEIITPSYSDKSEFKNCFIGPGVYIEKGVKIGENVTLVGNIYIYENTVIGNNVVVKPGVVIGGQGFGFERDTDGILIHFPHIGGVIIEDNVMIGSCTCIDKGTFGNTLLKKGCVIDNLVHIAHNVEVGENALVVANSATGGHVKIEEEAYIGLSTTILPGKIIGKKSLTGASSCVVKDVKENSTVMGVPAKPKE
jgi:acetyltransferase-like isoleucine patch superfamily enzyme